MDDGRGHYRRRSGRRHDAISDIHQPGAGEKNYHEIRGVRGQAYVVHKTDPADPISERKTEQGKARSGIFVLRKAEVRCHIYLEACNAAKVRVKDEVTFW